MSRTMYDFICLDEQNYMQKNSQQGGCSLHSFIVSHSNDTYMSTHLFQAQW